MRVPFALATTVAAIGLLAVPVQAKTIHFSTVLSGASEVPPNTTKGGGQLDADFDTATSAFTYSVTYSGLTGPALAAHFHGPAAPGADAPPVIPVKTLPSPIRDSAQLTADQAKDLLAGKWYFNLHTAAHPPGEIRGQLIAP
jgi:hypothetical protein